MDDYSSSVGTSLVGIIRADISCLTFKNKSRADDQDIIDYLLSVFNNSRHGCEQGNPRHQIPALIGSRDLDQILETSQLTRDDLRRMNLSGEYPKLNTSNAEIRCLHGMHRVKAAEQFLRQRDPENSLENCWWIIRLFTFSTHKRHHEEAFVTNESERYHHETPYCDGDVFLNVRYYQRQCRGDLADDWKVRLKPLSRQKCLSALLNHSDATTGEKEFVKAFERLEPFKGLWKDFQLSTMKQDFALRCDEELLHYLDRTHKKLNEITLQNSTIQQAFDIRTCRGLHGRAPSASLIDRQYITHEMGRALFSTVPDENVRQDIKQALLHYQGVFPTLKSYHKNLKYFSIGARIIRNLLLSEPIKTTMYRTLCAHWTATDPLVEIQEGDYRPVLLPTGLPPVRFNYMGLFIAAFRGFPTLGPDVPAKEREAKRKQRQGATVSSGPVMAAKVAFWRHAFTLGFRTEKVISGLRTAGDTAVQTPEPFAEDSDGEPIYRRSGKPYTNAYKQLRTWLFLPNLSRARTSSSLNPSVMFVQQDFLDAFFGCISGWEIAQSAALEPVGNPNHRRASRQWRPSSPELEQQAEIPVDLSSPGSAATPPSVSQYSQTIQQSRASSAVTEGHWSQFRLPILSDNDSVEEVDSVASEIDSRRTFPTLLAEEPQNFPVSVQDAYTTSPSTATPGRSFPDIDEHQSSPAASALGSQSRFELPTEEDEIGRRSFPDIDLQSTSSNIIRMGRRSFPTPELHDSKQLWPSGTAETWGRSEGRVAKTHPQHRLFAFTEYNGMTAREILTPEIEKHLEQRKRWVMMALKHNVLKTIRFEHIEKHMRRSEEEAGLREYFLVQPERAEHFRTKHITVLLRARRSYLRKRIIGGRKIK